MTNNEYGIVRDFWKNHLGIKVVDNPSSKDGRCIIYISSNGIWNPKSSDVFKSTIIKDDYYMNGKNGGCSQRSVFLRDVLKQ